jgi:site-specific recombinase XerD
MAILYDDVIRYYVDAKSQVPGFDMSRVESAMKRLQVAFGGRDARKIRRADVRLYIASRRAAGVKLATVQRELQVLSAAMNLYRTDFEIDMNNPASCLGFRKPDGRVRWLTHDEAERLIAAAQAARNPHFSAFLRLALNVHGCINR